MWRQGVHKAETKASLIRSRACKIGYKENPVVFLKNATCKYMEPRLPSNFSFPKELKNRILFTIGVLVIYRVGAQIPTPGVDRAAVMEAFSQRGGGVFGLLNTFTGGALEQFSILALGIIPYITASIIFQLLQTGVPYLEQLKKEGASGRKKINQYTRYATVLLAVFQAYGLSKVFLETPLLFPFLILALFLFRLSLF